MIFAVFYLTALWGLTRPADDRATLPFLAGGVGLGLAMATRTSAALIIPTWLTWTALAALRWRRPALTAREGWLLLLALGVFVAAVAKLLLPPWALRPASPSARYPAVAAVESTLDLLAAHPAAAVLVSLGLAVAALIARRSRGGPSLALASSALIASIALPDLIRNLAGFTANLITSPARLHHAYYGEKGLPPPGGFLTVIVDGLPLVVLIGLLAGLVVLTFRAARTDTSEEGGPALIVVLGIFVFLLIGAEIPKVAFRYLMPLSPLVCVAAAAGWMALLRPAGPKPARVAAVVIAVVAAGSVLPEGPHYATWSSAAGEIVRGRVDIKRHYSAEGHEQAAEWLWENAHPNDNVSAYCYADVLQYYWCDVIPFRRGVAPRPRIGWFPPDKADFIVVSARRRPTVGRPTARILASREPAFRVMVRGDTVMEVYDLRDISPSPANAGRRIEPPKPVPN